MKKGPLSKTEKDFINVNKETLSLDELANKLVRSTKIVESYIQSLTTTTQNDNNKQDTNSDMQLYARNKDRGVIVMTESASMASDHKKTKPDVYTSRKYRDVIHKIREE